MGEFSKVLQILDCVSRDCITISNSPNTPDAKEHPVYAYYTELDHSKKGRKRVTELFLVMMTFALPPTKSHNRNTAPRSYSVECFITLPSKPPSRERSTIKQKKGARGKHSLFCNRLTLQRLERQTYSVNNTTQRTYITCIRLTKLTQLHF